MNSYCALANGLPADSTDPNKHYHDRLYGFHIEDDNELFGRLLLEINQAGLSWTLILQRAAGLRAAYAGFDIAAVAAFGAIHNAQQILQLQQAFGSFKNWLDGHHPQPLADWVKLFRRTFKFTGPEIVREFLVSTGYLKGAHSEDCPTAARAAAANPPWLRG